MVCICCWIAVLYDGVREARVEVTTHALHRNSSSTLGWYRIGMSDNWLEPMDRFIQAYGYVRTRVTPWKFVPPWKWMFRELFSWHCTCLAFKWHAWWQVIEVWFSKIRDYGTSRLNCCALDLGSSNFLQLVRRATHKAFVVPASCIVTYGQSVCKTSIKCARRQCLEYTMRIDTLHQNMHILRQT